MAFDAAAERATLTLIASYDGSDRGLNLDGYVKGALLFRVPRGWRVVLRCANRSRETRYSCAVLDSPGSSRAAFPGARRPHPPGGLAPGATATFSFIARRLGSYRLAGLVGRSEPAGMWVVLDVVRSRRPHAVRLR